MNISVIGVGYIGTVIAAVLASKGNQIIGIDKSEQNIKNLSEGKSHVSEPGLEELLEKNLSNMQFTDDLSMVSNSDVIIVTVGTPLDESFKADISHVERVAIDIAPHIKEGTIICLKSTVIPGVTEEFSRIIEEGSKLKSGKDFFLAFSPERLAEGKAIYEFMNFPIVIGSTSEISIKKVSNFWESNLDIETIKINSYKGAELTKLADNLWIDVNIALANSLSLICYENDVDVNQVINAANSLPKGDSNVNILRSSIGVGGSCLTKDPLFFANLMDESSYDSSMIRNAREMNDSMPNIYQSKIQDWIDQEQSDEPRICIFGTAFKNNTNDLRYSPIIEVFDYFAQKYEVYVHDPLVDQNEFLEKVSYDVNYVDFEQGLGSTNIWIFGCAHDLFSKQIIIENISNQKEVLFVDGRHGFAELKQFIQNGKYIAI